MASRLTVYGKASGQLAPAPPINFASTGPRAGTLLPDTTALGVKGNAARGETIISVPPSLDASYATSATGRNISIITPPEVVLYAPPLPDVWQYVVDTNALRASVALNRLMPLAQLPADLVFPGISTEASPPPYGGNTLIFDSAVGAFRAGTVTGSAWVQANRGPSSAAFGLNNIASGSGSFISGGGTYPTGGPNTASGIDSAVLAGDGNVASAPGSSIMGGAFNTTSGIGDSGACGVATGVFNTAVDTGAFVGGGIFNIASIQGSFIGGGFTNVSSGNLSCVCGGGNNAATWGVSAILGGNGNIASGDASVVAGGQDNTAAGEGSFAAGQMASALHASSFVWADKNSLASTDSNQFLVSATGNGGLAAAFYTNSAQTTGVMLSSGASAWAAVSAIKHKDGIVEVDPEEILQRVEALPIYTYHYRGNPPSQKCVGPMADDWHALFPSSKDPEKIETMDLDGASLAAIKGCARRIRALQDALDETRQELAALKQRAPKA